MSCFRIKLFPAMRAWKTFTAKFHNLRISKSKPQTRYSAAPIPANRLLCSSHHRSGKNLHGRDSRVFFIRLKRGCLFKKKRKSVVYVDKLYREPVAVTNWIPAKQWKPEEEDLLPEMGIDERAEEFINRMKAEMIAAARNLDRRSIRTMHN